MPRPDCHPQSAPSVGRPASFCNGIGINLSGVIFPSLNPYTTIPFPGFPFASPIGSRQRSHARIHMLPIRAERQPRIQRLLAAQPSPRIRKVRHLPRLRIHHRQRLLILRLERPIPRVHRHHIAPIRRHRHRHRQRIQPLRISRHRRPTACSKAGPTQPYPAPTPSPEPAPSLPPQRQTIPIRRWNSPKNPLKVSYVHPNKTAAEDHYKSLTPAPPASC